MFSKCEITYINTWMFSVDDSLLVPTVQMILKAKFPSVYG